MLGMSTPFPGQQHAKMAANLTKRELFAAMAMQGFLANSCDENRVMGQKAVAIYCVGMADALLVELAKEQP